MSIDRPAFCSFSGGKDSCLALWHAAQAGLDVRMLVVMFDAASGRSKSHGVPRTLIEAQALALGRQLLMPAAHWHDYEQVFIATLQQLASRGYGTGVFGDIDLQAHRDWEERVCGIAGLRAELPLWQRDRRQLAMQFIELGFKARIVCVDSLYLGDEFCGRQFDADFIADLPDNVDACGENGEFHTFAYDGPLFSRPVQVRCESTYIHTSAAEFGARRYCFAQLTDH